MNRVPPWKWVEKWRAEVKKQPFLYWYAWEPNPRLIMGQLWSILGVIDICTSSMLMYSCLLPISFPKLWFKVTTSDGVLLADSQKCEKEPHGAYLADDQDCKIFYRCVYGNIVKMDCPKGTVFNPKLSVCDYPSEVPRCSKTKFMWDVTRWCPFRRRAIIDHSN